MRSIIEIHDSDAIECTYERRQRIVMQVLNDLRHNLSATPTDAELRAVANKIAQQWGEYGIKQEKPPEVDYSVPVAMMLTYLEAFKGK